MQRELMHDRFALAALSVADLKQPELGECAWYLFDMDARRQIKKGKPMTDDHLKQEAVKWAKCR